MCRDVWNLFGHLKKTTGLTNDLAVDWLVSAQVLNRDDAVRYSIISEKKAIALDWLKNRNFLAPQQQEDFVGEFFQFRATDLVELIKLTGGAPPQWTLIQRPLVGSVKRSLSGVPCRILIEARNASLGARGATSITLSRQRDFSFAGGVWRGDPIHLATPSFLAESDLLLDDTLPLAVIGANIKNTPHFHQSGANLCLASSEKGIKRDLVYAPFVLESPNNTVLIDSARVHIDNFLVSSGWWSGIAGFAFGCGAISKDAVCRIAQRISEGVGGNQIDNEAQIFRCSRSVSESICTKSTMPSPDGTVSRRKGEAVRPGWCSGAISNFKVCELSSSGEKSKMCLVAGGKRVELFVSREVAEDSNLLITELHAIARENNMGALVVYRRPPYSKDLFKK